MMIGGAVVNALAFSGSNYLFSSLKDKERERHDKAVEQLQAAHEEWTRKRTKHLDWINEELRRQTHAVKTFHDVDEAIREYANVTGKKIVLDPEPTLADFYEPSEDQKDREIAFVILGMGAVGFVTYKLLK